METKTTGPTEVMIHQRLEINAFGVTGPILSHRQYIRSRLGLCGYVETADGILKDLRMEDLRMDLLMWKIRVTRIHGQMSLTMKSMETMGHRQL